MVIKLPREGNHRESCCTPAALAPKGLSVSVSVCAGLERTSDPTELSAKKNKSPERSDLPPSVLRARLRWVGRRAVYT